MIIFLLTFLLTSLTIRNSYFCISKKNLSVAAEKERIYYEKK